MSDTMEDISYQMGIGDTIDGYHELLEEVGKSRSTKEFKTKLIEVNEYMNDNADLFGKGSYFISPALLENIEVVKAIEAVLTNQKSDKKRAYILLIVGAILGFLGNILAGIIF